MGERALPGGEFGEQRPHLGAAQPAQRDLGPVNAGQGLLEDLQPGADAAGRGVGQQLAELLVQVAAAARAGDQPVAGRRSPGRSSTGCLGRRSCRIAASRVSRRGAGRAARNASRAPTSGRTRGTTAGR